MSNVMQRRTLEKLYRDHKDHVYNYLTRLTSDRELAADITQQTFLKLLDDPNLETLQTPKAYIFTVARNTLYDEWKRKKERLLHDGEDDQIEAMADDPLEAPAHKVEQQDMQDKVEQAITLMKPKFRELMLLRYTEDLSVEEIADITGRTVNDVKVNLHRARLSFDKDFTYLMYSRVAKSRERCDTIGDLLTPLSDQELPREQIEVVAKHLSHCQVCARDMEEMKRDRKLFTAIPLIPAPMAFDQLVPQSAAAEVVSHTSNVAVKTVATKAVVVKLIAGVVVATVVAVSGSFVLRTYLTQPSTSATDPVATGTPNDDVVKPAQTEKSTEEKPKNKKLFYTGEPYVAKTVQYDSITKVKTEGVMYMSKKGARGEMDSPGRGKSIFIFNFEKLMMWAIDPVRKIYVEDNLDEAGNPKGELKMLNGGSTEENTTSMGVGQAEPCNDYAVKQKIATEVVLGRTTEKWQCSNSRRTNTVTEWFDPKVKLVVRSITTDGTMDLLDVQYGEQPDAIFDAPKGYRKVSFEELFGISATMFPGNK